MIDHKDNTESLLAGSVPVVNDISCLSILSFSQEYNVDDQDKPDAYRHMLRIEPTDDPFYTYTDTDENPFGKPGEDYSEDAEYKCEPLYLRKSNGRNT